MLNYDSILIKGKIGVEFRKYVLKMKDITSFCDFYKQIEKHQHLDKIPSDFLIFYMDQDNCLLPINNDDNLAKAIHSAKRITLYDHNNIAATRTVHHGRSQYYDGTTQQHIPQIILRRPYLTLFIESKGFLEYYNGNLSGKYKKGQPFKGLSNMILSAHDHNQNRPSIGMPANFRQVSSIIDADILPATCRRVRIVKHRSDRPLGFYIRDGTYARMNPYGQWQSVSGIFISRLVPGGLAESTGLLAVNDEVIEVNGIEVTNGKTLDQVTDMMVANSSNLIITIRPGRTSD